MRVTFKQHKRQRFYAKVYDVNVDGVRIACISEIKGGGWYFYAMNGVIHNTSHSPKPLEECKADAKEWAVSQLTESAQ